MASHAESKQFSAPRDDAPAHSANVIQNFLEKNGMPLARHASFSPDLASCDVCFPKFKTTLEGKRFQSQEDIMQKSPEELRSIP